MDDIQKEIEKLQDRLIELRVAQAMNKPPRGGSSEESYTQTQTGGFEDSTGHSRALISHKSKWDEYEELRKKDPSKYWRNETQREMHKDAQRLGDDFYKAKIDAN